MIKVCAIGEILIDFTPIGKSKNGNNIYEQNPGGGPANVSVATSMLGIPTTFIGKAGNDGFGIALKKALINKGVDVQGFVYSKDINTTLAFVHLDKNNDRSFSFYRKPGADITLTDKEVNYKLIDECELVHFSSVSLSDEPSRTTTINAIKYANKVGKLISYDPNLRELLWENLTIAKKVMYSMLQYADILKVSEEELFFLTGEKNINKACKIIQAQGIKLIFVTLGEKGATYLYKNITNHHDTYKVNVVDTTGCGDAFMGAIIYKVISRDKKLEDISKSELDDMNVFANMVGSLAATKQGGIPSMPSLAQVNEFRMKVEKL